MKEQQKHMDAELEAQKSKAEANLSSAILESSDIEKNKQNVLHLLVFFNF